MAGGSHGRRYALPSPPRPGTGPGTLLALRRIRARMREPAVPAFFVVSPCDVSLCDATRRNGSLRDGIAGVAGGAG